ncbi:MAG: hypothetical protein EAZ81_02625 [Verrucomicrobia bacterium]|nr:MAG: hypothetical protein EAZ81_02625 [Verrucomicrobiota bacterium]
MKNQLINTLSALGLFLAPTLHAQVTIYFAASNGDRNATQVAISRLLTNWSYQGLTGSSTGAGGENQAVDNNSRGSNAGTWNGTWNGTNVIIKTNYAGALAGIAAVADPTLQVRFDSTNGRGGVAIPSNPNTATNPAHFITSNVDFGLSTNFQSTSPFIGEYNGRTYNNISEIPVGISQLGFYASPGFQNTGVTNITTQQAKLLYDTGVVPLALFTGNWATDSKKYIYALGRNTDAGQRFAAQQEIGRSGIGFQYNWQPNPAPTNGGTANTPQIVDPNNPNALIPNPNYNPNNSFVIGSSQPIGGLVSDHRQWNNGVEETFSGITASGGYPSGATLATALTYRLSPTAYKKVDPAAEDGWYIGYVTPGDADATILGIGQPAGQRPASTVGVKLRFNGVENTPENVKNGSYTLWLYNRVVIPESGVAARAGDPSPSFRANFVQALINRIKIDVGSQQGIRLDDTNLKVFRTEDGGTVFPGTL